MLKGLLAGIIGTAAVQLLSGRPGPGPVYAPERLAGRLAERYAGRRLRHSQQRRLGMVLRWIYGPSWGAVFGELQGLTGMPFALAGLTLGAGVFVFELLALPLSGATPGLRRWGKSDIVGDAGQTLVFGLATASAMALLEDL